MNIVLYIVGGLLTTYAIVSSIVILKLYKRKKIKLMRMLKKSMNLL